jgi:two-component system sensor histidine kinase CpxA
MRSLYARIVLTGVSTLLVSLLAFVVISATVGQTRNRANISHTVSLELAWAQDAYHRDGPIGLAPALKTMDEWFESKHYLLDANGRDLLTGQDRSAMVPSREKRSALSQNLRRTVTYLTAAERTGVATSDDGQFQFIFVSKPWLSVQSQLPYHLGLLVIMSIIYSLAAMRIASSLKAIALAAERFGQGEWGARVERVSRADEIGNLGRTFNAMAERIRALIVSERRLLQDVSHELRSPLARLAFAAELTRTANDRDAAADEMKKHITCLTDLVSSLLQVTRMEGDPSTRRSESVILNDVIGEVVETGALQASERLCHLQLRGFSSQTVVGDRRLVTRALDNVVRNAIQFSPANSPITITVRDDGGQVIVEVEDHGPGVPETMLSRIFEPFFMVDDARQAATGGVGLGLAIVQRIVQVHNGWISATNTNPGLRVTIGFPASGQLQNLRLEARGTAA